MLEAIKSCMRRNKTLARYDFRNNDLRDEGKYFSTFAFNFYNLFSRLIFY